MEESVYNSPSLYLVSMGGENILFLRCHGIFDTGAVFQGHQKVVAKVRICLFLTIIVRVKNIWHEVFVKIVLSLHGLV